MKKILLLNKKIGETPLSCIEKFKRLNKEYLGEKITYAGRLDPMAEGLILALVGNERFKKENYLRLSKEYVGSFIVGIETDTYDVLGLPLIVKHSVFDNSAQHRVFSTKVFERYVKRARRQKFPPFSSKPIKGRPLFSYAREGNIADINLPSKSIKIHDLKILKTQSVRARVLLKKIISRIRKVRGDFRQDKIIKQWDSKLKGISDSKFTVVYFSIKVSSGTYIRSLIDDAAKKAGIRAVLFSLKRFSVGKYTLPKL